MWMNNQETVRKAVDAILKEKPEATLILGDFVYHASKEPGIQIDQSDSILEPLVNAGIPTFAVLGNHDYSGANTGDAIQQEQVTRIKNTLAKTGICVLNNQAESVGHLVIVGIAPEKFGAADVNQALDGLPTSAPRIVIMHNPDTFARLPGNSAPLAVATFSRTLVFKINRTSNITVGKIIPLKMTTLVLAC